MSSRVSVLFAIVAIFATADCRRSVESASGMAPTIKAGEQVTIDFTAYAVTHPRRWDVIAFEPPAETSILGKVRNK